MAGVKVTVKLNMAAMGKLEEAKKAALEKAAKALRSDLVASQTVPKETGELERSHFVDPTGISWGAVRIVADTPYGRRLYWHPEYNFRTDKNPNAQGKWMQSYIDGDKKDFIRDSFAEFFRKLSRGLIK